MDTKPKVRGHPKRDANKKKAPEKSQRERFIETARTLGVDESGAEFEGAIAKIAPSRRHKGI